MKRWKLIFGVSLLMILLLAQGIVAAAKLGERQLSVGATGEDVRELQVKLAAMGFDPGPADGTFGEMTKTAVMLLQQAKKMPADGIVGSNTIQLINGSSSGGDVSRGYDRPERYSKVLEMKAYAYSAESAGGNITATGTLLRRGVVAVDRRVIPLGTKMYIEGYGYAVAEDTGGAIIGNKIDVAMQTTAECYQWGVRNVKVYILD